MIEFNIAEWAVFREEVKPLLPLHWNEIALDKDQIPLDPDWEQYDLLAKLGQLHLLTARNNGQLVGYYVGVVKPHLHYKSNLMAFNDVLYMKPEYRQGMVGVRFFKEIERTLKKRGVQKMFMNTKQHHNFGIILERLGYSKAETIYTKMI